MSAAASASVAAPAIVAAQTSGTLSILERATNEARSDLFETVSAQPTKARYARLGFGAARGPIEIKTKTEGE